MEKMTKKVEMTLYCFEEDDNHEYIRRYYVFATTLLEAYKGVLKNNYYFDDNGAYFRQRSIHGIEKYLKGLCNSEYPILYGVALSPKYFKKITKQFEIEVDEDGAVLGDEFVYLDAFEYDFRTYFDTYYEIVYTDDELEKLGLQN